MQPPFAPRVAFAFFFWTTRLFLLLAGLTPHRRLSDTEEVIVLSIPNALLITSVIRCS